jgi:hypothetical protein
VCLAVWFLQQISFKMSEACPSLEDSLTSQLNDVTLNETSPTQTPSTQGRPQPTVCQACNEDFRSILAAEKHGKTENHNPFKCHCCDKTSPSKKSLNNHKCPGLEGLTMDELPAEPAPVEPAPAEPAPAPAAPAAPAEPAPAWIAPPPKMPAPAAASEERGVPIFTICQDCGEDFLTQGEAEKHGKEQTEIESTQAGKKVLHHPFKCHFCMKYTCSQKAHLIGAHFARCEKNPDAEKYEAPTVCQSCEENCKTHNLLEQHGKEKLHLPYKCIKCQDFICTEHGHLKTHMYSCKGQLHVPQGIVFMLVFFNIIFACLYA